MKKKMILLPMTFIGVLLAVTSAFAGDWSLPVAVNDMDMLSLCMAGFIVDKDSLQDFFTGLKTIFNNALKAKTGEWQKTAMEVPSTTSIEDYKWLTRFPKFRKWIGEKFIKTLGAGNYKVANEDWETTIEVERNDLEDDKTGIYGTQTKSAADSASELHDIIVDELKNEAFTSPCVDGQYFYDTDHPVGETSVSNKLTAALSSASRAAADASIGAARTMMGKFTDSEGMPLRLKGNLLEVPPALFATANTLATADKLDDGSNNPYKGTFDVLENPGLTSDTQWMYHNTRESVKPFIVQLRKPPTFVNSSTDEFMKRVFYVGAEARAAGVYGFWQLSVGSTGLG